MTEKPRKPRGFEKGGANYKPPGGAGWGGPASGAPLRPDFDAANQPPPEAKVAGKDARAEMRAYFAERTMKYAERIDGIAMTDPDSGRSIAAIREAWDRAFGKSEQSVTLGNKDPFEGMTADELDAAAAHFRRLGAATGGGAGEAGGPPEA